MMQTSAEKMSTLYYHSGKRMLYQISHN